MKRESVVNSWYVILQYYFGDYNLPTDKFLRDQVKVDDGWISLETMLKFKRLASITQDPAVIVSALANSEIIQVWSTLTSLHSTCDCPLSTFLTSPTVQDVPCVYVV